MNSENIIIKNLSVKYGRKLAVDRISCQIKSGRITGLLGRNGAGKTSMLRAISGRIIPSHGSVTIGGKSIFENTDLSSRIHITVDNHSQLNKMKLGEIVELASALNPKAKPEELNSMLADYGISNKQKLGELSLGQKSLFQVGLALSSNADYMFLDEGANALDAPSRKDIYSRILKKFIELGNTMVVSTHIITEIENLVQDVIIMRSASQIISAEKDELISKYTKITGESSIFNEFVSGKDALAKERNGRISSAYMELVNAENLPEGIENESVDLESIFTALTENKGEKNE